MASNTNKVVRLLEVFENENYVFFVMEYAQRGDLLNYMKKFGVMPEFKAKNVFFDIILGLEYLHSRNIIHRDIKLDNILLSDKFRAKIADFGISRINPEGNVLFEQCGTPAYLAPEIIKNEGYSGFATDIWSLGILLHTLLLGKVPFKA
jgi:serine/threonine protein kinase